jgi:cell division protein FtsZ
MVVGVGGAGCAAVEWVHEDCPEAATLAVNTDRISLEFHKSDTKVLLGEGVFHGRGSLGHAEAAEHAARQAAADLAPRLAGFDVVTILTSLGGGTGAGVAQVIAAQARDAGAAVVAVVTVPFRAERSRRARALSALGALRKHAHTTVVIDSEALIPVAGHLPINQALALLDYFMAEVPRSLVRVEAEARELVLAGGLGTLSYHEWASEESTDPAPLVLMEGAGAPGHLALLRVDAHAGTSHHEANRLAERLARAVSARHVPGEVRVSVRHDPAFAKGGRALAIVTGIQQLRGEESTSVEVTLQPTRATPAPMAPTATAAPAGPVPAPAPGPAPAPTRTPDAAHAH